MEELVAKISKVPVAQRLLIVSLSIILLIGGTQFLAIAPIDEQIEAWKKQIDDLDTKLVQKKAIARDLTRYRVEVERLKQRLNEALTLLPNEAEIPELLQKLASLVEQSDCQMEQFEPQGEVNAGFYARIPVKMAVRGNYHSIAVFFDKVSKLSRIVNVNNIELKNPVPVNKRVILNADFVATTFKFVEKAAAPGTPKG